MNLNNLRNPKDIVIIILGSWIILILTFHSELDGCGVKWRPEYPKPFFPRSVFPHCIIIGAMKCGTRALISMLADIYPQIRISKKEIHFFSRKYDLGIDWYLNKLPQMKHPGDLILEKSPSYFKIDESAERIYQHLPQGKFILIVCDPVRRAMSHFVHETYSKNMRKRLKILNDTEFLEFLNVAKLEPSSSFEEFLTLPNGSYNLQREVIQTGLYGAKIKPWLKVFHRDQLLILNGQNIINNPYLSLKQVESFLHLPSVASENMFFKRAGSNFYCWRYSKNGSISGQYGKCLGHSKGREHPKASANIIKWMKNIFTVSNEEFFNLTGTYFNWDMNET